MNACATCTKPCVRKYCSPKCSQIAQRGRKLPHSPEWERKRLAAVRASAKTREFPRGWKHKEESRQKMAQKTRAAAARNPEATRKRAIQNLPKDCSGEKNGNWRGGATKKAASFRTRESGRFKKWRNAVLERDKYACKECGATGRLDVHHIFPLAKFQGAAFWRANGVTLCRKCHVKTDSFAGHRRKPPILSPRFVIYTIPHHWQDYPTVGNWWVDEKGTAFILVSDLADPHMEILIAVHELVELSLCQAAGIEEADVLAFDLTHPELDDPGNDPRAPYHSQHVFAEMIERLFCERMGINWEEYGAAVQAL